MKKNLIIILLVCVLVFSGFYFLHLGSPSEKLPKPAPGNTPFEDVALGGFFYDLSLGNYDRIIPEYGGLYEVFHDWYPKVSLNDKYTLWKLVCERKDTYCLPVRDILSKRLLTHKEIFAGGTPELIGYDDVYAYEVTYQNPDGSIFEMNPWSWKPDGGKVSKFSVNVGRKGKNFFILTPPPTHN